MLVASVSQPRCSLETKIEKLECQRWEAAVRRLKLKHWLEHTHSPPLLFVSHLSISVATSLRRLRLGWCLIALVQPSAEIFGASSYLASLVAFTAPCFSVFLISFHLSRLPFAFPRTYARVTYEDIYRSMDFFPPAILTPCSKPGDNFLFQKLRLPFNSRYGWRGWHMVVYCVCNTGDGVCDRKTVGSCSFK